MEPEKDLIGGVISVNSYDELLQQEAVLKVRIAAQSRELEDELEQIQDKIKNINKAQFAIMKPGDKITFGRIEFQNNITRRLNPDAGFDQKLYNVLPMSQAERFIITKTTIKTLSLVDVEKQMAHLKTIGKLLDHNHEKEILSILGYKEHPQPKVKLLEEKSFFLDENGPSNIGEIYLSQSIKY